MAYQVLARKYRPQRFSDVIGQDHVTRTLLNALAQDRVAHGYIFSGHRGIGKTTIARVLAMALNCRTAIGSAERPTPEPCGTCESCTEIRSGNAVDVIEIDAATNRGIDEIRELRDAARYRPARDRFKIYILDEAHQITDAAFNALLKTLEEPPDHIIFMMATTQPEDIPQTIRSRCQHFSFHAVKFDDILAQLRDIAGKENIVAEDAALAQLAEAGDGSMRDALSVMDQAIASAPHENDRARLDAEQVRELMGTVPNAVFERLLEAVSDGKTAPVIEEINRLLNAGNNPQQLTRQLIHYLRNTLMAKIGGENSELLQVSPDERARAARSAALFGEEDLTRFLQIMLRTFDELTHRQEQRFRLELGLVKLVHLGRLLPVEEFLSRLPFPSPSKVVATAPTQVQVRADSKVAAPLRQPVAAAPAKPAFSPFEADRNRKIAGEATPTGTDRPSPAPRALTPLESTARTAESTSTKAPSASAQTVVPEATAGALALAAEPVAAPTSQTESASDLDGMRDVVTAALDAAGHNSAAVQLADAQWREKDTTCIEVEVPMRKVMLDLTINAEAEKICREALRSLGVNRKLIFLPGERGTNTGSSTRVPTKNFGSVQSAALGNPLVRQAQELFSAEVRSVIDLRPKK